ncbi:hypothetical protein C1I93_08075 [Micromonospora endophytica]|uniref:Uncharacterized protein n=1 Tax=Micromonospora endophytica TaxID=515350 RepID=A0A2W2CH06_9ACTN|nr:Scr1 family TA system antitoxin-like transcriptional regulator [Micromonospora endophytica]PZF98711.1 hypothetical protein C1I93_08075 [Micromonospora endophytica]RIW49175.1 hypothetical protein D3H59_05420 [Micromonospora endophytica]BCJ59058.1 hypothetical protein Jiend_24800 [Micromonospora endophytica]
MAARLGRQAILSRPHALIDEAVLRRALGGPAVMARQLRHLVDAAERPNVTLRVVPLTVGAHTGLDGSFALLDGEADRLAAVALSPAESVRLVARIATEHERE